HVVVVVVVFAVEVAIPLHAFEVSLVDRRHWRALLRIAQDIGPDIDAVLGRFPDLHPTFLSRRVVHRRGRHRVWDDAHPHLTLRHVGLEGALAAPLPGQARPRPGVKRPAVQRTADCHALHAPLAEWAAFVAAGIVESMDPGCRTHQGDGGCPSLYL